MGIRIFLVGIATFILAVSSVQAQRRSLAVQLDLEQQMAYLVSGRRVLLASPISSGRAGHLSTTGTFKIVQKERNHFSTLYGKIIDASGRTVVADADSDMRVPRGGRFIPAPMRYFMRYNGGEGMHAGYLPGYPASHGCVRMPEQYAVAFFNAVQIGTPVHVFGRTPRTRDYGRYGPQPRRAPRQQRQYQFDPRRDPMFDPRFEQPLGIDPYINDPRYAPPEWR